ncbi:MAG TPA: hypothetical protein VIO94_06425 [Phenylobacterium sp.]
MIVGLPSILRAFGVTTNQHKKARASGYLKRPIPVGRPGVPTIVSREAALEISFWKALVDQGYGGADASSLANRWVQRLTEGGALQPYWLMNRTGGTSIPLRGHESLKKLAAATSWVDMPLEHAPRPVPGFAIVNTAEIVARVDEILQLAHQHTNLSEFTDSSREDS